MPHERRQVYDGGGDGGGGGGDGGGHEGGHAEGGPVGGGPGEGGGAYGEGGGGGYTMDSGYTGDTGTPVSVGDTSTPVADAGTPAAADPFGGFDPGGHEAVHAGGGGGVVAGDVTGPSGGGGGAAVDTGGVVDTGGHEAVHAGDGGITAGDTTGTGGGGGVVDTGGGALPGGTTDTGIPGDVQPGGIGAQPGVDIVSDAFTSAAAGPYAGTVSTGMSDALSHSPSFTDIVSQLGTPTSIGFGDPFGAPFTSDDEDTQAPLSDYDVVTSPLAGALPGAPVSVAQVPPGVFPENWMTMTPTVMTSTPAAVAAPLSTAIGFARGGVPVTARGAAQPLPDDTPMTGLSPELAASLAQPDIPTPTTPDPVAATPTAATDPAAAATPAGGMVDITPETAEGPVTTAVNPTTNLLRGLFQGAGAAIGGPVAGLINQDPLAVAAGLGIPGVSEVASLASRLRGFAGMTGAISDPRGAGGPPGERSQPGAFRTLWQLLNGTLPDRVVVPPVGVQGRPSVGGFFNFDNDRFPLGVAPAAVDETYDIGQLRLTGQPPRGRAQLLTPAERRRFGMEVAEPGPGMPGSSAGGNEATGYIDDLLTAIGLEPTGPGESSTTGGGGGTTTPDTTPTPEQLPFGVDYFSGEATNWSPFIHGQRTAFDPRFFLGHGSRR
jgi:hypothetical protein